MGDNDTNYQNYTVLMLESAADENSWNGTAENETLSATCQAWVSSSDVLFQLAHLCFAVSFLAPNTYKYQVVFLRSLVALGNVLQFFWASMVTCFIDVLGWHMGFLFANLGYLILLGYNMYPEKIHPALEPYFVHLKAFNVDRTTFKEFTSVGDVVTLTKGAIYATEHESVCKEKLSVLLHGRMKVTCKGVFLHFIEPMQFLDSPEYEACPPTSKETHSFQVTIYAMEDSKLLTWSPKQFHQYLRTNPFIDALLTNLMGKDITVKLYQLQEMLRHPRLRDSACSSLADTRSDIVGNNNHDNAPVPTFNQTIEKLHRYSVSSSRKSVSVKSPRSPLGPPRFNIEHEELFNDRYDERLSPNFLSIPSPNQPRVFFQQPLLQQPPGGRKSIQGSPSVGSFETTVGSFETTV
ncbi:blood vessel epicardial substance-like [Lineus longissimus]|uniref:blood vessel epicardial substance-like n=1 Tax=Lineus longissimus TaxID=88925 RepID=UPI002B4C6392